MEDQNIQLESSLLSQKEIRRYSLQISNPALGISGQEKIKQSSILAVGAGGKGTSALENLVTLGVGTLGISDNFPVQEAELSRQHLYGNGDLGKQKAIIAREKLREINHLTRYRLHNVFLNEGNINSIAQDYDMLIDATGNFEAHYLINEASIQLKKPLVFACVYKGLGYVSVFNYMDGPGLSELFPQALKEENKSITNGLFCQTTLMSILGAIIANECLRIILNAPSGLNRKVLRVDPINYSNSILDFNEAKAEFYP